MIVHNGKDLGVVGECIVKGIVKEVLKGVLSVNEVVNIVKKESIHDSWIVLWRPYCSQSSNKFTQALILLFNLIGPIVNTGLHIVLMCSCFHSFPLLLYTLYMFLPAWKC